MENLIKDRAWIEINLSNLEHNINEVKKLLKGSTKIMAVVKANAYGHGSVLIANKLMELGITDFAVATLEEGVELRKNNISGNILILGYTSPEDLKYVIEYDLIQTIVDFDYAEKIKTLDLAKPIKCHVKINTGMNRIGERFDHFDKLLAIYQNPALNILGTFSHLCAADSKEEDDIQFTYAQINNFNTSISYLKSKEINPGKLHLQASYGTLNYEAGPYDYVRIGILMYGVHSLNSVYRKRNLDLKQVLSVKAKVTSVRKISEGETVGYSRTFKAPSNMVIAALSIGYADGFFRSLSGKDMLVKINGSYHKVIGRICMDQMIVDVSNLENIKEGDIVTLIGKEAEISAPTIAEKAGTTSYELLSRLGSRLKRIIVNDK